MAVPVGIEEEIYRSPGKGPGDLRVWLRLDRPRLDADIVEEFSGSWPGTTMARWIPALGTVTVAAGELQLSTTDDTNAFPVVEGLPGAWFPRDRSLPWDHKWTMRFPKITGFGVWYRVGDLRNNAAIAEVKNDIASGYSIKLLGTEVENLGGSHTTEHSFILRYTPATASAAAQYELFRDAVSKGTGDATDKQAFYWMAGNNNIPQSSIGDWSDIYISRVETDMTGAFEAQNYPFWTDKATISAAFRAISDGPFAAADDGQVWGRLPWLQAFELGWHERNNVDNAVLTFSHEGYISGRGLVASVFAGFPFHNLEVRIQSSQKDSQGRRTSWKELFRGLCDEPSVSQQAGRRLLRLTVRDKHRRRLQMFHGARGYSDASTPLEGVIMNLSSTEIMEDVCDVVGLVDGVDYNILANTVLYARNWNWLGEPALDVVKAIADDMVMRMRRNVGQTNPGRIEIDDYYEGTLTPTWFFNIRDDIVSIDFAETALGMVAQTIVTVSHSDVPTFAYVWPHAPVPSYGAVIRHNARVAQNADDINGVTAGGRVLSRLGTLLGNRELGSVVLNLVGQDWPDYDIECQISDPVVLGIGEDEYFQIIGGEYRWTPEAGLLTTVHLANQRPERIIQEASLAATVDIQY